MTPTTMGLRALSLALLIGTAAPLLAQDQHILFPVAEIEQRLGEGQFEIAGQMGSRFDGDRTQRTQLTFPDGVQMLAKWATAVPGGETFNNVPRYELAVYELQKLFLDEPDFVVPPTVVRAVPLVWYRDWKSDARATFDEAPASTLIVLQYWLWNVQGGEVYDKDRLERDDAYARAIGNLNVLTFLVRHNDANQGNFLISSDSTTPRVFAVDNGLSFSSEASNRGYEWRSMRVKRVPAKTVERLRAITKEQLHAHLGVLEHFDVQVGQLVRGTAVENLDHKRGVRRRAEAIQLGLTEREIDGVWDRLRNLLKKVDEGDITTF